jgi:hypothetical protein
MTLQGEKRVKNVKLINDHLEGINSKPGVMIFYGYKYVWCMPKY